MSEDDDEAVAGQDAARRLRAETALPLKQVETAEKYLKTLHARDADRLVKGCVRLALAHEAQRAPLKREDVIKKVLGSHTKAFAAVFERAQRILRGLFGLEMARLPNKDRAVPLTTLLVIVLSIILVEKRRVHSDTLFKHLETLGIYKNRSHDTFEKIEDVVGQFVKDEYLERGKVDELAAGSSSGSASGDEYVWGARAKIEYPEADIMTFVAKMFPDSETESIKAILSQTA
ncbi:hypothetical protein BC830DRAFT_78095 [Chytriomyces sp. MP71]|nr:hypothetical protein BC830DRAFT_78095 [Chytriomyces sp. MP71]